MSTRERLAQRDDCTLVRSRLTQLEGACLLAAAPSGELLAVGSPAGVTVLDRAGKALDTFELAGTVDGLDVSPDGRHIAVDVLRADAAAHDTTLISLATGRSVPLVTPEPLRGWQVRPQYGAGDKLLVQGDPLCLWDVSNPEAPVLSWRRLLPAGGRGPVFPSSAAFSSDGKRFAVAGLAPETITLFDTATFGELGTLAPTNHAPGQGTASLAFVDDDRKLLSHTTHSTCVWELETRSKLTIGVYETAMRNTFTLGVSRDRRTAVVSYAARGLIVFDTATGHELVSDWQSLDTSTRIVSVAFTGNNEFVALDASGALESFALSQG